MTLNSGALFDEEINGTTAGTLYDVTQVSGTPGTVALGNATLNVTLGYTPAVGDTYAIINATGGVSGTFTRIERFWRHFTVESSRNRAVNTGESAL